MAESQLVQREEINGRHIKQKTIDFVIFCSQQDRIFGELLVDHLKQFLCCNCCMFDDITWLPRWEQFNLHVPDQLCKLAYYKILLVSRNMTDEVLDLHKCEQLVSSIEKRDCSFVPVFLEDKTALYSAYADSSKLYGLLALSGIHMPIAGIAKEEQSRAFQRNFETAKCKFQMMKNAIDAQEMKPSKSYEGRFHNDIEVDGSVSLPDSSLPHIGSPPDDGKMETVSSEGMNESKQCLCRTVSTQTDTSDIIALLADTNSKVDSLESRVSVVENMLKQVLSDSRWKEAPGSLRTSRVTSAKSTETDLSTDMPRPATDSNNLLKTDQHHHSSIIKHALTLMKKLLMLSLAELCSTSPTPPRHLVNKTT